MLAVHARRHLRDRRTHRLGIAIDPGPGPGEPDRPGYQAPARSGLSSALQNRTSSVSAACVVSGPSSANARLRENIRGRNALARAGDSNSIADAHGRSMAPHSGGSTGEPATRDHERPMVVRVLVHGFHSCR